MSKARGLADLGNVYDDGALTNRNLIINGAMQVAQRGTSFTADNVYTLDRWKSGDGTGGSPNRTLTQEAFTLGQTDVPNAHYFLKHDQTVANTGANASLIHKIEDVTKFDGQTVTLSFYAKADASMDVDVSLIQVFGTGGSPSSSVTLTETVTIGTSWQKYTVTKTLGSLSGKTLGTDGVPTSSLNLAMVFQSTSTFTFEATLFQLEYGDTATPFEHRSYGDELASCQRYCQKIRTGVDAGFGMYHSYTSSSTYAPIQLPVTMRATPSASITNSDAVTLFTGGTNYNPSATTFINASPSSVEIKFGTTGNATAGDTGWYRLQAAFTMILNAEL